MNKLMLTVAASAVIAGGTVTTTTLFAAAGDDKVAVQFSGAPVNCVQLHSIRSTKVVDERTIDFRMAGGKTLRNTMPHSCPGLKFEDRFSYKTSLGQLCSIDTIRVLHDYGGRLQEGAACGLGKFQPVEPAQGG